jgi:hypothetical protein
MLEFPQQGGTMACDPGQRGRGLVEEHQARLQMTAGRCDAVLLAAAERAG